MSGKPDSFSDMHKQFFCWSSFNGPASECTSAIAEDTLQTSPCILTKLRTNVVYVADTWSTYGPSPHISLLCRQFGVVRCVTGDRALQFIHATQETRTISRQTAHLMQNERQTVYRYEYVCVVLVVWPLLWPKWHNHKISSHGVFNFF